MPDLTIETRTVCKSNVFWQTQVEGSRGDIYTVFWGLNGPGAQYQYGWHCDCASWKYRQSCRHVTAAELERCKAGEDAFAGGPGLGDVDKCPACGGPVEYIKVAV